METRVHKLKDVHRAAEVMLKVCFASPLTLDVHVIPSYRQVYAMRQIYTALQIYAAPHLRRTLTLRPAPNLQHQIYVQREQFALPFYAWAKSTHGPNLHPIHIYLGFSRIASGNHETHTFSW